MIVRLAEVAEIKIITNPEFADDIGDFAEKELRLEAVVEKFEKACTMETSAEKTK